MNGCQFIRCARSQSLDKDGKVRVCVSDELTSGYVGVCVRVCVMRVCVKVTVWGLITSDPQKRVDWGA